MLAKEKLTSAALEETKSQPTMGTLTLFVTVWRPGEKPPYYNDLPEAMQGHQIEDYDVRQCMPPGVGDRHQDGAGTDWIMTDRQTYIPAAPGHWLTVTIAICTIDGNPVRRQNYDNPSDRLTIHLNIGHLDDGYQIGLLAPGEPLPNDAQVFQVSGDRQPGNPWEMVVIDHIN